MQTFTINKHLEVICESINTRYGFKHLAILFRDGEEIGSAKCCYYNRTWERYQYENVLEKLAHKNNLTKKENQLFKLKIKNQFRDEDPAIKNLKTIGMVAGLGELFGQTQKEKNDWKERMLRAGLEGKGLDMPADWDSLDEDTKEARLNGAINQLK